MKLYEDYTKESYSFLVADTTIHYDLRRTYKNEY